MVSPQSVLLDTNIWLDYYFPDRSGSTDSFALIDELLTRDICMLVAAPSLKDVYYIAYRLLRVAAHTTEGTRPPSDAACNAVAWGIIDHLCDFATVVVCDVSDVWTARKLRSVHGDFEDNLVIAAAQRAEASYIATRDEKFILHSPVSTLTPHDLLAVLQST